MAYVAQQIPDEQQNLFARKDPSTPNPVPPQTGGSAGGGANTAPGMASSTQFGSNAAKLSDYLNANKDQAAQFGQQVAGNLNQNYQNTVGAIDQGFGNFNQQVGQGWNAPNNDQINKAASNPTEFAKNPDNVKQFQGLFNDQYQGPNNFEGTGFYGDLNDKVNNAVQNSSLTKTMPGLGTYLNNSMGANDTTQGMQTLDSALLMGNPDSQKAIRDAASQYGNLSGYLGNTTQKADQNVANAKQQADATRQDVQNRFTGPNGVIPTWEAGINSGVNAAQTAATTNTQKEQNDIQQGTATPSELNDFNANPAFYSDLFNLSKSLKSDYGTNFDLGNYFSSSNPGTAITPTNFASADDYAKAAALAKLTGQDTGAFLNPENASQAGTAPNVLGKFNLQGADQDAFNALGNSDSAYIQANPQPSTDPAKAAMQRGLVNRNPQLLNNQFWASWWNLYGNPNRISLGIGPSLPPPITHGRSTGPVYKMS